MRYLTLILAVALLAGCATNPYTGEEEAHKAGTGAAIGAAVGAVAGALTTDDAEQRRTNAIIGLGIGALSGAGVGYYMDRQEDKLRAQLQGSGVSVTRQGDNIILNMPSNITFEVDSSALKDNFFSVLNSVSLVLNEYEKTLIDIAGHTDSTGSDEYNMHLSKRRADAVGQYLISQGIPALRIKSIGYGETRPIAPNSIAAGRQLNRRVELTLVPITQ